MGDKPYFMLEQFDLVRISTTKNVNYLIGPPGTMPDPNSIWTVIACVGPNDILLSSGKFVCKIPKSDLVILAKARSNLALEILNGSGEETRFSIDDVKEIWRRHGDEVQ